MKRENDNNEKETRILNGLVKKFTSCEGAIITEKTGALPYATPGLVYKGVWAYNYGVQGEVRVNKESIIYLLMKVYEMLPSQFISAFNIKLL